MTAFGLVLLLSGIAAMVRFHKPSRDSRRALLVKMKHIDHALFLELSAGEQLSSDLMISGNVLATYIARKGFSGHSDEDIRRIGQRSYEILGYQVFGFLMCIVGLFVLVITAIYL